MVFPIRTPRVNNNDDVVRLSAILARPGSMVAAGEAVCEVETDKATFTVETEREGYFLQCPHSVGDAIAVGSLLAWIGGSADDQVPEDSARQTARHAEPTLKAQLLLRTYGLTVDQVPTTSDRLSAADVEVFVARNGLSPNHTGSSSRPEIESSLEALSSPERGMLRTVTWHRDEAVPGYVEITYNTKPWEEFAAEFHKQHKFVMSPLLGLMAFQLVGLRSLNPKYNATIHGERKLIYQTVNIGFTVQSTGALYLAVIANAERLTQREFVLKLAQLQKAAMKNRLEPSQTTGATIGFTSMARWGVVRHQPILSPHTSLMVAHAAAVDGCSALGATYDHRILTGADAVTALNFLKEPPS